MSALLLPAGEAQPTLFEDLVTICSTAENMTPEEMIDGSFQPISYPQILDDPAPGALDGAPAAGEPETQELMTAADTELATLPVVEADTEMDRQSEELDAKWRDKDTDQDEWQPHYERERYGEEPKPVDLPPHVFGDQFFPTPRKIALKMLRKVSKEAVYFLEPSAGWGSLAQVIDNPDPEERRWGNRTHRKLDVIESHPDLIAILEKKGFRVVGFDWLDYDGVSYYDAVIANPPFAEGAKHLLKMWDFLHEGEIVCLLNAETVRNPYTEERKRLHRIIAEHGNVEFLGPCFQTATRKSDVEVAMVYLKKKCKDDSFDLWEKGTEERHIDDTISEDNLPACVDQLGNLEHFYNRALEDMFKGFQMIRRAQKYMAALNLESFYREGQGHERTNYEDILKTAYKNYNAGRAEFTKKLRRDAWYTTLKRTEFHKWLDKIQVNEFLREIERNGNIPFTAANIKGTLENIFLQRRQLFEKSCWNVFSELTRYDKQNTNYHEGWKTNDNYKVNRKVIFPYGCDWDTIFNKFRLRWDGRIDIYNDLDRVLAILDGTTIDHVLTIHTTMDRQFESLDRGFTTTKICYSKYFKINFWKKGTVHLTFLNQELLEKFNHTAAAGKKWVGSNTQQDPVN